MPVEQPNTSLVIHNRGSHRVTMEQLRNLPEPPSLGRLHKPIPHYQLVDVITEQIKDRGWDVKRLQLGVNKGGQAIFGIMDLVRPSTPILELAGTDIEPQDYLSVLRNLNRTPPEEVKEPDEMGTSFGFRSSTNKSIAIRGVAGGRVFVCDNLVLSGSEFVLQQKSTIRLNLQQKVSLAIDKFIEQSKKLIEDIAALKGKNLSDIAAESMLYKVFSKGALPTHLLDDVDMLYFRPQEQHPDCQPRTAWGLHNACTRAAKRLNPSMQFSSTMSLGRVFNLAKVAPVMN